MALRVHDIENYTLFGLAKFKRTSIQQFRKFTDENVEEKNLKGAGAGMSCNCHSSGRFKRAYRLT